MLLPWHVLWPLHGLLLPLHPAAVAAFACCCRCLCVMLLPLHAATFVRVVTTACAAALHTAALHSAAADVCARCYCLCKLLPS